MPPRSASNPIATSPLAFALALVLVACVGRETRGVQLYPGPAREPGTVATLVGDIDTVDGREVESGARTFELLPGCHVVTTRARVEKGWTVAGMPPRLTFVFQARPGHGYVLEYTGRGGTGLMNAREKDANGQHVAALAPTSDRALIERCQLEQRNGLLPAGKDVSSNPT